jgi:hypothetical protein
LISPFSGENETSIVIPDTITRPAFCRTAA